MKSLLVLLTITIVVSAHGYVDNVTIGGQFYQAGLHPITHPYSAAANIHTGPTNPTITSNGPVQDVASIDLQCGGISSEGIIGSEPAPLHAPVEAGLTVNLRWMIWPDSHMGPIMTYVARCPDEGCVKWLPGDASTRTAGTLRTSPIPTTSGVW
ncbi:hypothetical protein VTI74DRAFT_9311 [Chaetomium olivicolor]